MIRPVIAIAIVASAIIVGGVAVGESRDAVGLLIAVLVILFAALSVAVLNRFGGFEPPACKTCGGLNARSAPYCKHCGASTDR